MPGVYPEIFLLQYSYRTHLYSIQHNQIAGKDLSLSAGDDGFFAPADQDNHGIFGERKLLYCFSAPVMELIDRDLAEMDIVLTGVGGGT